MCWIRSWLVRNSQMASTDDLAQPACPHRFVGIVCWGLFLVMLSSCTTVPVPQTSPVSSETSAKIIETLQAREANVVSLKGLFEAELDGKGMAFAPSLQGTILYQRPDQFRIKGFTRFGGLVFDFVLSHGLYALRVKNQPRPIVGGSDDFQRLGELRLPVLLSLRAIEVLLGKLPLVAENSLAVQQGDETYQFDIPSDSRTNPSTLSQRIVIDQRSLHVRQLDYVNSEGESVVSIRTSDFRLVRDGSQVESGTILLPFGVQAEDHVEAGSVVLEFMEIIVNEPLDKQVFTLAAF